MVRFTCFSISSLMGRRVCSILSQYLTHSYTYKTAYEYTDACKYIFLLFWLYNSLCRVLSFSTSSFHIFLSWTRVFQFGTFNFCISFLTSFFQRTLHVNIYCTIPVHTTDFLKMNSRVRNM